MSVCQQDYTYKDQIELPRNMDGGWVSVPTRTHKFLVHDQSRNFYLNFL